MRIKNQLYLILIKFNPCYCVLKIHSTEIPYFSIAIGIVNYDAVYTVIINTKNQKSAFSIPGTWTHHRFSPSLHQLHFYFLVKFYCSFEDTKQLMTQRMNCNWSWAFVYGIFVLFLNMLYVTIINDVRSC